MNRASTPVLSWAARLWPRYLSSLSSSRLTLLQIRTKHCVSNAFDLIILKRISARAPRGANAFRERENGVPRVGPAVAKCPRRVRHVREGEARRLRLGGPEELTFAPWAITKLLSSRSGRNNLSLIRSATGSSSLVNSSIDSLIS